MTNATLIDGKLFAAKIRSSVTDEVRALIEKHGLTPGLAVVLVGDDPASQVYVKNKGRQTIAAGMQSFEHMLPSTVTQRELLDLIDTLNNDQRVNGILVQLPLPDHIDESTVLNAITPSKDVDGFHPINVGNLHTEGTGIAPCTPYGCSLLLKDHLGDLSGKNAVVIGRSNIVGKPMAALLLAQNCTVTIAHSRTKDIASVCRQADIIVVAVGIPGFVKADWVKAGATIIDVGINRIDIGEGKTRLVGDVDFDNVHPLAGAITPVPGGVGPMTIACLLYNTLLLTCQQNDIPMPTIATA